MASESTYEWIHPAASGHKPAPESGRARRGPRLAPDHAATPEVRNGYIRRRRAGFGGNAAWPGTALFAAFTAPRVPSGASAFGPFCGILRSRPLVRIQLGALGGPAFWGFGCWRGFVCGSGGGASPARLLRASAPDGVLRGGRAARLELGDDVRGPSSLRPVPSPAADVALSQGTPPLCPPPGVSQ